MAADDIIKIAVSAVKSGIKTVNVSYEKIMGIGIAAPGQVDLVKNIITYYPRIQGMKRSRPSQWASAGSPFISYW